MDTIKKFKFECWMEEKNSIPAIIWGEKSNKVFIAVHGNMSDKEDKAIKDFCNKFNCELSILENGEHYFHTESQLKFYEDWIDKQIIY